MNKPYKVGHGKPPKETQFKKGQSGNPKGRPKGAQNLQTIFGEELFKKKVSVREGNRIRKLNKAQLFATRLSNDGAQGKGNSESTLVKVMDRLGYFEPVNPYSKTQNKEDKEIIAEFFRDLLENQADKAQRSSSNKGKPCSHMKNKKKVEG